MPSRKSVPCVLSLIVGIFLTACFVLLNGSLGNLLITGEHVSALHYWYGWLLVGAVFWLTFVLTWAAYSGLLYLVNRYFPKADSTMD